MLIKEAKKCSLIICIIDWLLVDLVKVDRFQIDLTKKRGKLLVS